MSYSLDRNFDYHAPDERARKAHEETRAAHKELAKTVIMSCPNNAERQHALHKIEEAMMWANASIARGEGPVVVQTTPATPR